MIYKEIITPGGIHHKKIVLELFDNEKGFTTVEFEDGTVEVIPSDNLKPIVERSETKGAI